MQAWSKQTKQYFLIAVGILLLALVSLSALYLYGHQGHALPEVLYVVDEAGSVHGPHSPLSRAAIHNLREAGLDTMKKEYPILVLLNNRKTPGSAEPALLMSDQLEDLPQLINELK